jgi:hypothetical protein
MGRDSPAHSKLPFRRLVILSIAAGISTAALVNAAHRLIPHPDGTVGHDYRYFFPYLLTGAQWIYQNGWFEVPYFTPDFCGGMPWLANPQSVIYSLPQILTLLFADPVAAARWSLFICAIAGGAAAYVLLRHCFKLSWQAAGLGFVLFQLNGFLFFRMAVGHLTYHTYGLIPGLCLCVIITDALPRPVSRLAALTNDIVAAVAGAFFITIMVYGGAINYIIPAILSVCAIIFIYQAKTGLRSRPWLILTIACAWAVSLSALKLLPAFVFVSSYPRTYLAQYLFDDSLILTRSLLSGWFVPETHPFLTVINHTGNVLGLHEFEFGVSIVPLFLIMEGLVFACHSRQRPHDVFPWIGLVIIAVIPIMATFGNASWGKILLQIPIINNNTVLTRWWSIYIMILIVLAALSFDRIGFQTWKADVAFIACVVIVAGQLALRDFAFYTNGPGGTYDPAPVTEGLRQVLLNAHHLPSITQLGAPSIASDRKAENDGLLVGISSLPCYEPIFGYDHEMFPVGKLRSGPVDQEVAGHFNIADPRCYLTGNTNACRPGDQFLTEDRAEEVKFISRLPLNWQQPAWQVAARTVTISSLGLSIVILVVFCFGKLSEVRWFTSQSKTN